MYIPPDAFGGATPERTMAVQMKCVAAHHSLRGLRSAVRVLAAVVSSLARSSLSRATALHSVFPVSLLARSSVCRSRALRSVFGGPQLTVRCAGRSSPTSRRTSCSGS